MLNGKGTVLAADESCEILKNVNWSTINMIVTTVQWNDKQVWSADQLNR